jgi:hypothetical protein
MIKIYIYITASSLLLASKCQHNPDVLVDMSPPQFSDADTTYKEIFFPLDGIWVGSFRIYEDPEGQKDFKPSDLTGLDVSRIDKMALISTLSVRQEYKSITPYFQKVRIIDTYVEAGDTNVVESSGVNKVENGMLWCVVQKPTEKIVHQGRFVAPNTLIWSRSEKAPLRKEYFEETVSEDNYQILGYGYYGTDDPTLSPKTWFIANYQAISDFIR